MGESIMSFHILVVGVARRFCSDLSDLLTPSIDGLLLESVENRRQALVALETRRFSQLITGLKIPGVSDGYRLLSQIAGKTLDGDRIIALVDHHNDQVRADISRFGAAHVYTAEDLEIIQRIILGHVGLAREVPAADELDAVTLFESQATNRAFPLAMADQGDLVQVQFLPQGGRIGGELRQLGLGIGDRLLIVQKQPGGAVKIEKNGVRYGLGVGLTHKIAVIKG